MAGQCSSVASAGSSSWASNSEHEDQGSRL
jgi:hypothetical protein